MIAPVAASDWLAEVARRAGLRGLESLPSLNGLGPLETWEAVCRACNLSAPDLAKHVAKEFQLPLADLTEPQRRVLPLVPEKLARRHLVFPLRESDRRIVVATSDPTNLETEQALGFAAGRTPTFEIAPPERILRAIDEHYAPERVVETLLDRLGAEAAEEVRVLETTDPEAMGSADVSGGPIVKLASLILHEAIRDGASDIHLEPGRGAGTVRYRVDGVLRTHMQIPMPILNRLISRIKIIGSLDISDRLRPQDGHARVQALGRTIDLRLSTVPAREAEKAVIRLLDPQGARRIDDLGMPPAECARFRRLLSHRDGIVVVTGPTGSGKTTTLYSALKEVASGEVNVMTVEDPVEIELPGITQIQVEPKRGITFASALRSILRQDPDVIFVGEIRDLETAEVAVQASMTGHFVLATLHTNDAVGTIARLADLGLDRFKIAATLRGAVGQRLLRRLCPDCSEPATGDLPPEEARLAARLGVRPTARASGCSRCGRTGYRGRLPILEVLAASAPLEALITSGAPVAELQRAAIEGGLRTLRDVALEAVTQGRTSLQEVERVLGEPSSEEPAATHEARVLVVDDDAVNRRLVRAVLARNGFQVTEAEDGAAALERLDVDPEFSLVVLDLEMPKVSGGEVLERIRATRATAALPVIVLTGSGSEESEIRLMEAGADDYVRKPLDPARFTARVRAVLRRNSG